MKRFRMTIVPWILSLIVAPIFFGIGGGQVNASIPGPGPWLHCGGWSVVPSPNPISGHNSLVGVVASAADDVWAIGNAVDSNSGRKKDFAEHWNGKKWRAVSIPNPSAIANVLYSVTSVPGTRQIWAAGYYIADATGTTARTLFEHWDGTQWSVVPGVDPGPYSHVIYGVSAVSANDIWAVGYRANGWLTEHWDGTQWNLVRGSIGGFTVTAVSANNIWVTIFKHNRQGYGNVVFKNWNGTKWSVIPSPSYPHGDTIYGVATIPDTDQLWAVGYYQDINFHIQSLTEHWNGKKWSVIPSPNPGSLNVLNAVAPITGANTVWAVGSYINRGPNAIETLTVRWDGQKWHIVPSPNPGNADDELFGVAQVPGASTMWTVGYYIDPKTGYQQTLIEYYC